MNINSTTAEKLEIHSQIFHNSSEGNIITDNKGIIIAVNPAFIETTGYSEEEVLGKKPNILSSGRHNIEFYINMWATVYEKGQWSGEVCNKRKNGEIYTEWLTITATTDEDGKITNYIGIFTDISVNKKNRIDIRLYERVFNNSSEGIMITNSKGIIVSVNSSFTRLTGYTQDEAIGERPSILHSGKQDVGFYINMWASIHEKGFWTGEIWNKRKGGEVFPEWLSISTIYDEKGETINYVGIFSDITDKKKSEEYLIYLAHFDTLTSLPNRVLFKERLELAIEYANRYDKKVAVLYLDLDKFKVINDTLGHDVGDYILKQVSERLTHCVRNSDTVARLGGDEFSIILPEIKQQEDAISVAKKIFKALTYPFFYQDQELFITTSIGITFYPNDALSTEKLLKNADSAMYRAKEQKSGYQLYSADIDDKPSRERIIEHGIHEALKRDELDIHYQPQIDLKSKKIIGVEALLRWNHPELGNISPAEFIPLAEQTDLIVPIGEWVMREACREQKEWSEKGYIPITVAVNLSESQFMDNNLVPTILKIIKDTQIEAKYLNLEITEIINVYNINKIIQILTELREIGVKVSIDDFGTGILPLSYLKNLPITHLKIDKSFIDDLILDKSNLIIIKAIIEMAHGLNLKVVAEGVESEEQLLYLGNLNFNTVQGYYFYRPMSSSAIEELLAEDAKVEKYIN